MTPGWGLAWSLWHCSRRRHRSAFGSGDDGDKQHLSGWFAVESGYLHPLQPETSAALELR